MENIISELEKIRNGYEFDSLEKLFHSCSIEGVTSKLFIKITEAKIKNKNVDVSEQEKMIEYLEQANRWMGLLYRKFEQQNIQLHDLVTLTKQQAEKIKLLNEKLNF